MQTNLLLWVVVFVILLFDGVDALRHTPVSVSLILFLFGLFVSKWSVIVRGCMQFNAIVTLLYKHMHRQCGRVDGLSNNHDIHSFIIWIFAVLFSFDITVLQLACDMINKILLFPLMFSFLLLRFSEWIFLLGFYLKFCFLLGYKIDWVFCDSLNS